MIQAVLFDLDGTLLDTAPDLGFALNQLLAEDGLDALPHEQIRPWASWGARGLLQLGYEHDPESDEFATLRERFLSHYSENLVRETCAFPGMADTLNKITDLGLQWGIVTNKPAAYTDPLVAQLEWPSAPACVISGDAAPRPKPDPAILQLACKQIDVPAEHCVYVGDAERDMQAAAAADIPGLVALWGYIQDHEQPDSWPAAALLETPESLSTWLESQN